jgi:uncharacterized protein Smg (DUF494 family)
MDPERDRLKHLLIILLEALSSSVEEGPPSRNRIQEKVADAGLDEGDVHGLLDWIESNWNAYNDQSLDQEPLPESPSSYAYRVFGDSDQEYITSEGIGYLIQLVNAGQITRAQMEALLQYSSFIALKPMTSYDLETVIEQVLFRSERPGMTGGASEGFESRH